MRSGAVLWVCALLALVVAEAPTERIVRSPQGPVRGYKQPGDNFYTFYGIPYATAPTGPHKFQAPLPAPLWFSVLDAVDNTIVCPQAAIGDLVITPNATKKEDCLIANVYVPDTEQKNLPVVVYVHGGAYQVGCGVFMEAKHLVRSKKVIMVTFNYRLGIHGFLCLGTKDVPGNAGMKDQVELLRWVKRNIASYGGNPNDVTIAGYSAGSSSVDLLILSQSAKDLFHKAIPESGASLAAWSVQIDPVENAKTFARSVGFEDVDDIYALEEFYKSASYDLLISDPFLDRTDFSFLFSPCVERSTEEQAFLTDSPYNILKSGKYNKVPMLYGMADMEGLMRINEFGQWKDEMNANFSKFLPADLKFENENEREEISKKIKKFYFDGKPVDEKNIHLYLDYMSDLYFDYSVVKTAQLYVNSGNEKLFLYQYNYVDKSAAPLPHVGNDRGADHCAQTLAVFDGTDWMHDDNRDEVNIAEDYKKMKSITRDIWLNFITTGTPSPEGSSVPAWPPAGADCSPHMSLNLTPELRGSLVNERVRFLDEIYERHYSAPQPPPAPPTRHTEL